MDNKEVQEKVKSVAEPVQRNYESVIRQLRDKNAVGVVVAVNGEIVWADIFASTQLLQKYWPKLVRSYATEAVVTRAKGGEASSKDAQKFLNELQGRHETAETEPGIYRQSEITGDGFKVFELTSLLPKTGFPVHVAKMADEELLVWGRAPRPSKPSAARQFHCGHGRRCASPLSTTSFASWARLSAGNSSRMNQ